MHCRPIAHHEVEKKQSALRYVRIETAIALACSFLINLFIVSVFAKVGPCDTVRANSLTLYLHSREIGIVVALCLTAPKHTTVLSWRGLWLFRRSLMQLCTCRDSLGGNCRKTLACSMLESIWQATLAPAISIYGA